jgi:DNA primase
MSKVVDVLKRHLGSRIKGDATAKELNVLCPFHKGGTERTPSFRADTDRGLCYCNVCHQGWNLRQLLYALGLSKVQVDIELADLELAEQTQEKIPVVYIPDYVLGAYRACPTYMLKQGFRKDVLQEYEIGWDKQYKRVVFPIRDHLGRLVALYGRNSGEDIKQRYVVYKDELKGVVELVRVPLHHYLWGMDRLYALGTFGCIDELILVEGIKKALWLKQLGWDSVVALNGSRLSPEQHSILSRLNVNKLTLLLDNDDAGRRCISDVCDLYAGYVDILIPKYPAGKTQPDSLDGLELAEMLAEKGRRIVWTE